MGKGLGLRVVLTMATQRLFVGQKPEAGRGEAWWLGEISNDSYLCTSGDLEV